MKNLKPCAELPVNGYTRVGQLFGLPHEFDAAKGLGATGRVQYTRRCGYIVEIPETPGAHYVAAIERWERDGPWRIVLHRCISSVHSAAAVFEYAGPFDNLEAAVVAYMLLWP